MSPTEFDPRHGGSDDEVGAHVRAVADLAPLRDPRDLLGAVLAQVEQQGPVRRAAVREHPRRAGLLLSVAAAVVALVTGAALLVGGLGTAPPPAGPTLPDGYVTVGDGLALRLPDGWVDRPVDCGGRRSVFTLAGQDAAACDADAAGPSLTVTTRAEASETSGRMAPTYLLGSRRRVADPVCARGGSGACTIVAALPDHDLVLRFAWRGAPGASGASGSGWGRADVEAVLSTLRPVVLPDAAPRDAVVGSTWRLDEVSSQSFPRGSVVGGGTTSVWDGCQRWGVAYAVDSTAPVRLRSDERSVPGCRQQVDLPDVGAVSRVSVNGDEMLWWGSGGVVARLVRHVWPLGAMSDDPGPGPLVDVGSHLEIQPPLGWSARPVTCGARTVYTLGPATSATCGPTSGSPTLEVLDPGIVDLDRTRWPTEPVGALQVRRSRPSCEDGHDGDLGTCTVWAAVDGHPEVVAYTYTRSDGFWRSEGSAQKAAAIFRTFRPAGPAGVPGSTTNAFERLAPDADRALVAQRSWYLVEARDRAVPVHADNAGVVDLMGDELLVLAGCSGATYAYRPGAARPLRELLVLRDEPGCPEAPRAGSVRRVTADEREMRWYGAAGRLLARFAAATGDAATDPAVDVTSTPLGDGVGVELPTGWTTDLTRCGDGRRDHVVACDPTGDVRLRAFSSGDADDVEPWLRRDLADRDRTRARDGLHVRVRLADCTLSLPGTCTSPALVEGPGDGHRLVVEVVWTSPDAPGWDDADVRALLRTLHVVPA